MSAKQEVFVTSVKPLSSAKPAWWLFFVRELADLWIGGKALNLILIYSVILGIMVYVFSFNSELSLIPPKESVYEMLKNAMAVSLFIALVIGADTISGERERATLESVLLTPTSRRQIVVGKFLAAFSAWPAAYLIAIPFMNVLSQGDEVLVPAIIWGAITGTALVMGYTGLGMLVSFWSGANKVSYFVSLGIYVLFLVPAQLPGRAQTGAAGQFLQWVNPLAATNHFLSKHLVNYRTLAEFWTWLISPVVFSVLILVVLFLYAAPGLRLEAGKSSKIWSFLTRVLGLFVIATLIFSLGTSPVAAASGLSPTATGSVSWRYVQQQAADLQIDIDMDYTVVKTGDKVEFNTLVTNNGSEVSPPLIVAMNVINLDAKGDVVDPEDWSPQRTQYIDSLGPGEFTNQVWIINTILDGDYMVYMVLVPAPDSEESTSQPVASSGIHLTVTPFTRLNPGGVLPYAIGGPILLLLAILVVNRLRRRNIDMGGS
ncbi:MAG TPA: ABC transporter permease subunit [Anaerolineales bacterium]